MKKSANLLFGTMMATIVIGTILLYIVDITSYSKHTSEKLLPIANSDDEILPVELPELAINTPTLTMTEPLEDEYGNFLTTGGILSWYENTGNSGISIMESSDTDDPDMLQKSKIKLPHNGLFIRRNNAFGTKQKTSLKELIAQGIMIEQEKIRFDDFVALNTEGIPLPKTNNALVVSYGIAAIPTHQKRDERATHYLEIALKTANAAPIGYPETKAPPVNYIFVVDVSGSMSGEKIDTVKAAIRELFTRLRADDVIGVVAFNHQAQTLLESTPKQLPTKSNWIDSLALPVDRVLLS